MSKISVKPSAPSTDTPSSGTSSARDYIGDKFTEIPWNGYERNFQLEQGLKDLFLEPDSMLATLREQLSLPRDRGGDVREMVDPYFRWAELRESAQHHQIASALFRASEVLTDDLFLAQFGRNFQDRHLIETASERVLLIANVLGTMTCQTARRLADSPNRHATRRTSPDQSWEFHWDLDAVQPHIATAQYLVGTVDRIVEGVFNGNTQKRKEIIPRFVEMVEIANKSLEGRGQVSS